MTPPRLQPKRAQACNCYKPLIDTDGSCAICGKYTVETISTTFAKAKSKRVKRAR